MKRVVIFLIVVFMLVTARSGHAQAVAVSMRLDTNTIVLGATTTLRIFAQVVPALRPNAEQIFSWYVDVLNTNGSVAAANYTSMVKPASDNDPDISSNGSAQGPNRQGIYDTFLNLPRAGVTNPVELMSIPVTGVSAGLTRFLVQPGTTVPELSYDFIVAPIGGDTEYTGGDYTAAGINLRVIEPPQPPCVINLRIARLTGNGGPGQRLALTFVPCPGFNHTVLYRDALNDLAGWRALPGAPHNSGSVTVTNNVPSRFYRVAAAVAGPLSDLRLSIAPLSPGPGSSRRMSLTYPITAGYNYTIEFKDSLALANSWQPLPGAPHNSGNITVTNTISQRFYRLKATPQ